MKICLILEGCYPYVFGGVSTWMHQYINKMKEHEFVLWVIGAKAENRGKFVYEFPENVTEVHEVFLDDALRMKDTGRLRHSFSDEETQSLRELMLCGRPDWEILFRLYHDKHMNPMSFLKSEEFLQILIECCEEHYPYIAFADAFSYHAFNAAPGAVSDGDRGAEGRCIPCNLHRLWRSSCLSGRLCEQKRRASYRAWDLYT